MPSQHRLNLLYFPLFGLLILALWNPTVPWREDSFDLLILLDDSLSMNERKNETDWMHINSATKKLPQGSRTRLLRFASQSVEQVKPYPSGEKELTSVTSYRLPASQIKVDSTFSNIETSLNHALRLINPNRNSVIMLITDGYETIGNAEKALRIAKHSGVTVYGFKPAKPTKHNQVNIDSMELPTRARLGQRIPIDITVSSSVAGEAQLQVLLDGLAQQKSELTLHSGRTQYRLWIDLYNAGANLVELRIRSINKDIVAFDSRKSIVNVQGPISILYVNGKNQDPSFAQRLQQGNFPTRIIQPNQFPHQTQTLKQISTIVLDDIAITDMPEAAWMALIGAVKNQGTGLLVLGGLHSFGAGGYRRSRLEDILPVTTEGKLRNKSAAVQFLVDKSGSMDSDSTGISRLAMARQAVLETSRALAVDDRVGLIAFDIAPRELLTLDKYQNSTTALEDHWQLTAGGGTKLVTALDTAIKNLSNIDTNLKLLVLVTDGFISNKNLRQLEQKISSNKIDLIALAVGSDVDTSALQNLAQINNGRLLRIDKIARLPRIMREEVEKRRNPVELGITKVISNLPLAFLSKPKLIWPTLSGYMVTTPRPNAKVYLNSEIGDPLAVMNQAGAGKVLVLPGGLGTWAQQWLSSPIWDQLSTALVSEVAVNHYNPAIHVEVTDHPGYLNFVVDSLTDKLEWTNREKAVVMIRDPSNHTRTLELLPSAPGRYQGKLNIHNPGRYKVSIRIGKHHIQHELLHGTHSEFFSDFQKIDAFKKWQNADLIKPWNPGQTLQTTETLSQASGIRSIATTFALLFFILLIVHERGLTQLLHRKAHVALLKLRRKIDKLKRNAAEINLSKGQVN